HDRGQRRGQVEDAGTDHLGGCGHSRPPLENLAALQVLLLPCSLDRAPCHLGHGRSFVVVGHRLLCRFLVANRPAGGEAPPSSFHPEPAEETRCRSNLKNRTVQFPTHRQLPRKNSSLQRSAPCFYGRPHIPSTTPP